MYSKDELYAISKCIETADLNKEASTRNKNLYAIRQLLTTITELKKFIFNDTLIILLDNFFKLPYFLTKAIYFDKPPKSNWFVAYHQDLSISVDSKAEINNYKNWTTKKNQYGVQPPTKILEDTITVRIHLDNTSKANGALKVIPKSHLNGIIRKNSEHWNLDKEFICEVKQGGIMLMKPLLLHASNKTINNQQRRVIHLEFNHNQLAKPIHWLEHEDLQ